jgi:D-cysteine desulfhydrase
LTLAAAKKEGLKCQLVLQERAPGTFKENGTGNNLLYHLLGVDHKVVVSNNQDPVKEMEKLAEACREGGEEPYIIPGGGSNEIGALGYVECLYELKKQTEELGLKQVALVLPSGSSGTHAGVVAGAKSLEWELPIVGISVMRDVASQTDKVFSLAEKTLQKLESDATVTREDIVVFDDYVGPGYAISTQEMIDATTRLARTEGILVDPVYTGKAFAGYCDRLQKGDFDNCDAVIFLQTGGSPAVFAYQDEYNLDYSFEDLRA